MGKASNVYTQSFPPPPPFTENELDDLSEHVFIVIGRASGVGFELVKVLYQKHGTVYVAARSEERGAKTTQLTKATFPQSHGKLMFLFLDLDDLTGIRKPAEQFMSREQRLDVLWNNAGVALPPDGSKNKQGHELQLGTNCIGPPAVHTMPLSRPS